MEKVVGTRGLNRIQLGPDEKGSASFDMEHYLSRSLSTPAYDLCPGWQPFFKFTGFREDPIRTRYLGFIVWTGIAKFFSGRKERVWYQVTISVDRHSMYLHAADATRLVEAYVTEGVIRANQLVSAGYGGMLLNWWRRKCRMVESVTWQHWDEMNPIQDKMDGVLLRGEQ